MMRAAFRLFLILASATLFSYGIYYTAEQVTAAPLPEEGEEACLYSNQSRNDLTKVYLQSIASAQQSILLLIYNLTEPSITHALRQKAEEGIDVTVICDGKASIHSKKYLGSRVRVFERRDRGLMHLKILVIDERLTILGSANLSRHSLRIHGNLIMALESSEIAAFIKQRAKGIAANGASKICRSQQFTVGGQAVEMWFLPENPRAVDRIIQLIDQAKKTIKIAMYTWTRKDFAEAVVRSALRGVTVEVIMDRDAAKGSSQKIATYLNWEKIPLFVNTNPGLLHHKFLLIDNTILVNGSANWTKAAFTLNNDCFIILHDLTEQQRSLLSPMWETTQYEAAPFINR